MKCQLSFSLTLALASSLSAQNLESNRVEKAGEVTRQILDSPERILRSILDQADCVVTVPSVLKFTVGKAGSYGGLMTCRGGMGFYGAWGAPAMVALEGIAPNCNLVEVRRISFFSLCHHALRINSLGAESSSVGMRHPPPDP
jgi:lipid-binding SYLF domain-containing protein